MSLKLLLTFTIAVFELVSLNKVYANSCKSLLNTRVQPEVLVGTVSDPGAMTQSTYQGNGFLKHVNKRKQLERIVHQKIGVMAPGLERELSAIFGMGKRLRDVPMINQNRILEELERDSISRDLSFEAKSKLIRLIFQGFARPYMALLIARYLDEKENNSESIGQNVLEEIDTIVLYYTIEWAILALVKHRFNDLLESDKVDILAVIENPEILRRPGGFNYNRLNYGGAAPESLFLAFYYERENFIASTSFGLLLRRSIFD